MTVDANDIRCEELPDSDPDTSYLEQDGWEERLAEYNDGGFGFIGVRATVNVVVNGITQTFRSASLWGIESDSSAEYVRSIFEEKKAELVGVLEAMGFAVK